KRVGGKSLQTLHQFAHRLVTVDQVLRTAAEVRNCDLVHVDAQALIQRGEHFAEINASFSGFAAKTVSRANDLTVLHATGREHSAGNARPMVAPGIFVDRWRAAEFAPHDDGNVFVEPARVNIL